jgi:hypothetical protein
MLLSTYNEEFILSNTLIFLLTTLVFAYVEENNALVFPMGSNGTFITKKLEAIMKRLPTNVANFFKMTT